MNLIIFLRNLKISKKKHNNKERERARFFILPLSANFHYLKKKKKTWMKWKVVERSQTGSLNKKVYIIMICLQERIYLN